MASVQSAVVRSMIRKSNMWNRPLDEIRNSMQNIPAKSIPAGIINDRQNIGGVPCEVFRNAEKQKNKAILYFHGGGFCMGIYHANREFVARLSKITGMDIYLPDYSLAPEHPFPAALNDAIAAYKGLLDAGYNACDIFVMGDSSGCSLAVSALLMLRQDGFLMPCAMAFLTPVFDLTGTSESLHVNAANDPFQLKDPLGVAKLYVGENDTASLLLSPLYGDLRGLPPMLIHAAEYDVFAGDAERFLKQAADVGLPVEYKVWRKMWHIFHMQAPLVPEASKALKEVNSYLASKF